MQGDIVSQGIELMVFGMGTVVLFLALLVVATTAMSRVLLRYFPEPELEAAVPVPDHPVKRSSQPGDDPQLVAVVSAAIQRYRASRE
jgi:oxaloacetate decarboxylase gamma subunit